MPARFRLFVDNFGELVDSCISFYEKNKRKMSSERIQEKRVKLSVYAKIFHERSGTLTTSVQKRIEDLEKGIGLVLMTAHQPNFFAYSGVLRKATLNFVLAKRLEDLLEVPVINFFGIADQDFTDDRWVRSCQLPAVQRSGGILSINVKTPEKLMLNKVAKPSTEVLQSWKIEIEKWLAESIRSVNLLCRQQGLAELFSDRSVAILHKNFKSFWNVVEECHGRSEKYSDFNAFLMSKIVNQIWGYDTVFSCFSECQQTFIDDFCFLLSRHKDYSRLVKEAKEMLHDKDGVSDQEPLLVPFWYHCNCGSKVKLFLTGKKEGLSGDGMCIRCGESYELQLLDTTECKVSNIASRISARAISMPLVFFNGLMPSCYVGGVGGVRYLMEAEHVAKGIGIPFPPVAVWRPRDKYLGVGQAEALLQLRRICGQLGAPDLPTAKDFLKSSIFKIYERIEELERSKRMIIEKLKEHPNDDKLREKMKEHSINQTKMWRSSNLSVLNHEMKILESISTVFDLMPSIIDYALNVGLKETSNQWIRHLNDNGSLSSGVHLRSLVSEKESNYMPNFDKSL
jgi:hypothetical protein